MGGGECRANLLGDITVCSLSPQLLGPAEKTCQRLSPLHSTYKSYNARSHNSSASAQPGLPPYVGYCAPQSLISDSPRTVRVATQRVEMHQLSESSSSTHHGCSSSVSCSVERVGEDEEADTCSALPLPIHTSVEEVEETPILPILSKSSIPAYGKRKGWKPTSEADFGGGGAYPEVSFIWSLGMMLTNSAQSHSTHWRWDARRSRHLAQPLRYRSTPMALYGTMLLLTRDALLDPGCSPASRTSCLWPTAPT